MDEALSATAARETADLVEVVCIHVPRGRPGNTTPAHQLDAGRGPYWCDKTRKFSREIRVLTGHVFCSECSAPVIGMIGVYGEVIGVE